MRIRAGLIAAMVGLGAVANAAELDFSYASRLPEARGEARDRVHGRAADGLQVTKTVFMLEHDRGSLLTHVAAASCGDEASVPPRPYMVALQYLPKTFQSFAQATLLDGFSEVYVADETARIRLYRNVPSYVMVELTERFKPACVGI